MTTDNTKKVLMVFNSVLLGLSAFCLAGSRYLAATAETTGAHYDQIPLLQDAGLITAFLLAITLMMYLLLYRQSLNSAKQDTAEINPFNPEDFTTFSHE